MKQFEYRYGRIEEEVSENIRRTFRRHDYFALPTAILGGLAVFTSLMLYHTIGDEATRQARLKVPQVQEQRIDAIHTRIDKDELSDLVIGNKILLANQTDGGIIYRPLSNSDVYRIR